MSERDDGGPIELPMTCGRVAMVSREDYLRLAEDSWRVGRNGYAYRTGANAKGRPCLLHRIVLDAEPGQEVHHRDGNKLNCVRENLELTTAVAHQEHHKHSVIARNIARRVHPSAKVCPQCSESFVPHPDHRGRQRFCSKRCGGISTRAKERAHAAA